MASSSIFNSAFHRLDSSSLSLHDEIGPLSSEKELGVCRNPQILSTHAPISSIETHKSSHDQQAFVSRSRNSVVISGFAIAATTAFGLSIFALDGFAIAAELDVNSATIESVGSAHSSPTQRTSPNQSSNDGNKPNPTSYPSMSSNPASNLSFSMAIPIPHEQQWIIVRKGYIAPMPRLQRHESSSLKCPQWTPSKLEMFLPDFNGRPKPFPRQGHHWSASFVVRGAHNEAFLQLTDFKEDVEKETGTYEKASSSSRTKLDKQEIEGRLSLLKALGMEKFICFSM